MTKGAPTFKNLSTWSLNSHVKRGCSGQAMFMDHPLRTLLFELFVAPPLRFLQRGITPTDGTKPEVSHNPSKASVESETLVTK